MRSFYQHPDVSGEYNFNTCCGELAHNLSACWHCPPCSGGIEGKESACICSLLWGLATWWAPGLGSTAEGYLEQQECNWEWQEAKAKSSSGELRQRRMPMSRWKRPVGFLLVLVLRIRRHQIFWCLPLGVLLLAIRRVCPVNELVRHMFSVSTQLQKGSSLPPCSSI